LLRGGLTPYRKICVDDLNTDHRENKHGNWDNVMTNEMKAAKWEH
jgi:hypothetical protein